MAQTVPATAVLGPGKTGLTIGLRVLNLDGTEYAAFSTTGVAETSTLGTYRKASGVVCPDAGAYIVWGVSGTDYAEATVEPVTALSDIQARIPAALIGGRIDATVGAMATDVLTAAALNADAVIEIADALLKRDMSAVTGESARSPLNALRALRNKVAVVDTTMTVYKEDDSTSAWTATVTGTTGADPVTSVDPT